jgi:hypothetical protein
VRAHIAGDILEVFGEFEDPLESFTGDFGIAEFGAFLKGFVEAFGVDATVDFFGEESDEGVGEGESFSNFADDASDTVGTDCGDSGDMILAIFVDEVVADIVAAFGFKIDVNIGVFGAIGGEEPLEVEVMGEGIDAAESEAEGNCGIHDRAASAELDVLFTGPLAHIPGDEEMVGVAEGDDAVKFTVDSGF